jgi:hypothetical protein
MSNTNCATVSSPLSDGNCRWPRDAEGMFVVERRREELDGSVCVIGTGFGSIYRQPSPRAQGAKAESVRV